MAVKIFDRYLFLSSIGHFNFDPKDIDVLVCTCLLIAAKFEQPLKPDFVNMIHAYKDMTGLTIGKEELINLEQDILMQFGFDFNFSSPI